MSKHAETSVNRRRRAATLQRERATDRPYLVRLGPTRWIVRGGSPGYNDESLLKAFAAIVDCLRGRPAVRPDIRVDRRAVRPRRRQAFNASPVLR